jgi:hypothetical protein
MVGRLSRRRFERGFATLIIFKRVGRFAAWLKPSPAEGEKQPQILRLAALAQDDSGGLGLCDPTPNWEVM